MLFRSKSYGVLFSLFGSGPEMVRSLRSHRSLRPKEPGVSGPLIFAAECLFVVRYWTGVRRHPEMVRSLRPTGVSGPRDPESPASGFSARLHLCGAVLDRGPEHHRRNTGVSGLAGVSGPLDRNLRSAPMIQQARSLAGISGPGRSLRPEMAVTAGFWERL